jgi:hypothetical protein
MTTAQSETNTMSTTDTTAAAAIVEVRNGIESAIASHKDRLTRLGRVILGQGHIVCIEDETGIVCTTRGTRPTGPDLIDVPHYSLQDAITVCDAYNRIPGVEFRFRVLHVARWHEVRIAELEDLRALLPEVPNV